MTRKQIYQTIANFTGDWKKAKEFERIFSDNCLISPRQITELRLSFGKNLAEDGRYYGENRDTLHFAYAGKNETFYFSILR